MLLPLVKIFACTYPNFTISIIYEHILDCNGYWMTCWITLTILVFSWSMSHPFQRQNQETCFDKTINTKNIQETNILLISKFVYLQHKVYPKSLKSFTGFLYYLCKTVLPITKKFTELVFCNASQTEICYASQTSQRVA